MPELPEVETVRRGLAPAMEGGQFTKVQLNRPGLRFTFPPDFAARINNRRVREVARRAKYLMVYLDNDDVLIMHLGMSGSFHVERSNFDNNSAKNFPEPVHHQRNRLAAHDHVIFDVDCNGEKYKITYNDPRRFGFMDLIAAGDLGNHKYFANLGIEPTGNSLDGRLIAELFGGRKAPLKSVLLDQKLIAGLGNIYVCEALWQAGLAPTRIAKTLAGSSQNAKTDANRLADAVRDVISRAIEAGGSSLNDHRQTDGTLGYFQHNFGVYDREGETCSKPGCKGEILRIIQSGRSTYFCNTCQT